MLLPASLGMPDPTVLTPMTDHMTNICHGSGAAASSAVWVANLAMFFPVRLTRARTYTKAFWLNGATAAGNVDVGIYTISGTTATRIAVSTAVAQAGVSDIQIAATFPTTTIGPGLYYLAISASLSTTTFWRTGPSFTSLRTFGCFQASTAHPLATPQTVVAPTNSFCPVFGFAELATI